MLATAMEPPLTGSTCTVARICIANVASVPLELAIMITGHPEGLNKFREMFMQNAANSTAHGCSHQDCGVSGTRQVRKVKDYLQKTGDAGDQANGKPVRTSLRLTACPACRPNKSNSELLELLTDSDPLRATQTNIRRGPTIWGEQAGVQILPGMVSPEPDRPLHSTWTCMPIFLAGARSIFPVEFR